MSVTIIKDPVQIYPVYNRNYFKLVDSRCTNPGFKYIVRLGVRYGSSAAYTTVGKFDILPLADGSLEFDPNPILNNYVTNTYNYLFSGVRYTTSLFQYYILISAQDNIGITEYPTIKSYASQYCFDGAMNLSDEPGYTANTLARILPSDTHTVNRSLSNIPTTLRLRYTDYYSADFFLNDLNSVYITRIYLTTKSGGVSREYTYSIPSSNLTIENAIASVGIGPQNLMALTWTPAVSGPQPFTYDIESYSVTLYNNVGTNTNCSYNVILDCQSKAFSSTKMYDRTWLIYKSRLGGWSYLLFDMKRTKTIDVKKTTFDRKLKYNEYNTSRGITSIGHDNSITYVLSTNWVDKENELFFEDLFTSPQVYMLNTYKNGVIDTINPFVPVHIKDKSFTEQFLQYDKMFTYTVEVAECEPYIRQLR